MTETQERAALALTKSDFDQQALAMLPSGYAWTIDPQGVQPRLMQGLVGNHYRAYQRIRDLLDEADPRTTYETLPMWEIDCGLPDPCIGELAPTIELRRADVIAKRQTGATTTPQQFIDLAARLGYEISIIEFRPFRTWSGCDSFINGDVAGWSHCWLVEVHGDNVRVSYMRADSPCDAFLAVWGDSPLECIFDTIAPVQTRVLYAYTGALPPP